MIGSQAGEPNGVVIRMKKVGPLPTLNGHHIVNASVRIMAVLAVHGVAVAVAEPSPVVWQSLDSLPPKRDCHAVAFEEPHALAMDGQGNLYVANEKGDAALQEITPDGEISSLLNRSSPALRSGGYFKLSLAIDHDNHVILGVGQLKTVERVQADGSLVRVAGVPGAGKIIDGPVKAARIKSPSAVAVDRAGGIYVADSRTIRKITSNGTVMTLAGNERANDAFRDGHAFHAAFNAINGMVVGSDGSIYVVEGDRGRAGEEGHGSIFGIIRKIAQDGQVTTLAGNIAADGVHVDGLGREAGFFALWGITQDKVGTLYVTEEGALYPSIRQTMLDGQTNTILVADADGDRDGAKPSFRWLTGIARDERGNIYVVDTGANKLHKIDKTGFVTTLCECR
jgi:hypothetical protein